MAITPIMQVQKPQKRDKLETLALALQMAEGVLGTALKVGEYKREGEQNKMAGAGTALSIITQTEPGKEGAGEVVKGFEQYGARVPKMDYVAAEKAKDASPLTDEQLHQFNITFPEYEQIHYAPSNYGEFSSLMSRKAVSDSEVEKLIASQQMMQERLDIGQAMLSEKKAARQQSQTRWEESKKIAQDVRETAGRKAELAAFDNRLRQDSYIQGFNKADIYAKQTSDSLSLRDAQGNINPNYTAVASSIVQLIKASGDTGAIATKERIMVVPEYLSGNVGDFVWNYLKGDIQTVKSDEQVQGLRDLVQWYSIKADLRKSIRFYQLWKQAVPRFEYLLKDANKMSAALSGYFQTEFHDPQTADYLLNKFNTEKELTPTLVNSLYEDWKAGKPLQDFKKIFMEK